jgi:hypothetical protein
MKKRLLFTSCLSVGLFLVYLITSSNSGGISGVFTTGCTCHGIADNSTLITLTGAPSTVMPGATYNMTLTVSNSDPNMLAAGFDLWIATNSGTLSNPSTGTVINTIASGTEMKHTAPQTLTNGSASWTFDWTVPTSWVSNLVIFQIAGNTVNMNGLSSGDKWKQTNFTHIISTTVNTSDLEKVSTLTMYPNPTNDELYIVSAEKLPSEISVVSITGALLKLPCSPLSSSENKYRINLSQLAEGCHFILGQKVIKR